MVPLNEIYYFQLEECVIHLMKLTHGAMLPFRSVIIAFTLDLTITKLSMNVVYFYPFWEHFLHKLGEKTQQTQLLKVQFSFSINFNIVRFHLLRCSILQKKINRKNSNLQKKEIEKNCGACNLTYALSITTTLNDFSRFRRTLFKHLALSLSLSRLSDQIFPMLEKKWSRVGIDAKVIKLHIFVLRTFSPYFRKMENRALYLCKTKYGNTEKISIRYSEIRSFIKLTPRLCQLSQ